MCMPTTGESFRGWVGGEMQRVGLLQGERANSGETRGIGEKDGHVDYCVC